MAKHWYLSTSAPNEVLLSTFRSTFFERPELKDRLKLSKSAQLRSQQVWEETSVEGALVAAVLVRGGLREAVSDSKRGVGSGLGTTIGMDIDNFERGSVAQLWLANFNTYLKLNAQGDQLKPYAKHMSSTLKSAGFTATGGRKPMTDGLGVAIATPPPTAEPSSPPPPAPPPQTLPAPRSGSGRTCANCGHEAGPTRHSCKKCKAVLTG